MTTVRPGSPVMLRRWIPSPGTALLLSGLAGLAWWLRTGMVTSSLLARAQGRFAAALQNPGSSPFKWEDAAVLGTHYATLLLGAVALAALVSMRAWFPRPDPACSPVPDKFLVPPAASPRYRFMLLALLVLAAGLRLPLASGSMWWDELWNVKYATVGEWRQEEADAGKAKFFPTSWSRAAWYYNKPTNHPVLTLPSKLSHTVWQKLTGAAPGKFSEIALRLPVLAAGLAALWITASLAMRLAGPRAGLTAAALIAVHPWLIRYGVDARSYGLTLFFMAAALYSLDSATRADATRRTAWWWAFGACQFFLMWAHVVAHFTLCAALFGAAAWLIWRGPSVGRGRLLAQLLIINLTAAVLLMVVFLPNLLQALTWGERNDDGNFLTAPYLLRTLTQIAAGMEPALNASDGNFPVLSWWGIVIVFAAGLAAVTSGFRYLAAHQRHNAILLALVLVASGVFWLGVKITGFYFYHRFSIALGIPILLLAAIGLSRLPRPALTVAAIAGFAALTYPQTRFLLTRSYAPFRETVADLHAAAADPIPVGYGLGSHVMQCYDPVMRDIRTNAATHLQACIDEARSTNRPLLVALGYEALNRLNLPEGFRLLDDPALFERISVRHGLEPEFTFHLLRLKPLVP